jgi:hypothetical protein
MMIKQVFTLLFVLFAVSAGAQDKEKLFGTGVKKERKKGFIINANGDFDIPGADMAKRFGYDYRIGPAILYKTTGNWLFGAKCDFIFGGIVRQDSLMVNIRDKYSGQSNNLYEFINNNGERIGVPVFERGYAIGLQVGKIISFSKLHPDNGLVLLGSAGFMQHKINIYDKDKSVAQLTGQYLKGYDRLTNGSYGEAYVGYIYFARNGFTNFTLGLDALFGFTQGRRNYLYDVMRTDTKQRLDILFGVRGGWFIPIFRKKSDEMMFE